MTRRIDSFDDSNLDGVIDSSRTTNRRAILRSGIVFGAALPLAAPAYRVLADEGHAGHGAATPVAATPVADGGHGGGHDMSQGTHDEMPDPRGPVQPFVRYDPVLPPVEAGPKSIEVVAMDVNLPVAHDVVVATWTFDGTVPGRALRVVEGDRIDVTFRVDHGANAHHSLDFHAAKTPPNVNFETLNPGESLQWSFVAKHPGAFTYHCGTTPMFLHIGAGMYGAIIVDPAGGWSPAQELVLVQSEFSLQDTPSGIKIPDKERVRRGHDMDFVVFNGHATQYVDEPIMVMAGEPVRIFFVNAGPNAWSSFHVIGTVFDRVLVNGSPKNELFDLQSVSVGPGDSACVEFTLDEPGMYPIVDHAMGHSEIGAMAMLMAM